MIIYPNRVLIFFILFFVFFPYVFPLKILTSDLTPWILILSIIYLIFNPGISKKIDFRHLFVYFLAFIFAFFGLFLSDGSLLEIQKIRALYPYLMIPFVLLAMGDIFESEKNIVFFRKIFFYLSLATFLIIFIQATVNQQLFAFLAGGVRTSIERGVTGLHKEPSIFAASLVFLYMISSLITIKWKIFIHIAILVSVFLLVKSVVGIIYLLIFILSGFFFRNPLIFLSFILLLILVSFFYTLDIAYSEGWRITRIIEIVQKDSNLTALLSNDASTHDRFSQIYFSIMGFFTNNGMPHFYLEWQNYLQEAVKGFGWVREEVVWLSKSERVFSGYGGALFELGFMGLVYIVLPIYLIFKNLDTPSKRWSHSIALTSMMFSAIPLSFPPYLLYLALIANFKKNINKLN